jgi:hypothetical protein
VGSRFRLELKTSGNDRTYSDLIETFIIPISRDGLVLGGRSVCIRTRGGLLQISKLHKGLESSEINVWTV